jgi:hypothetical protein
MAQSMSAKGLGRVKTPTFNLRVEIPSRFRKFENQKCLRPLLREDDRENNSAHSWLVHVFTQPGSKTEVAALRRDVCFAPVSGHRQAVSACPKSANTGIREPKISAFLRERDWLC